MNYTFKKILGQLPGIFKSILEKMLLAERSEYLEGNLDTKGNGYYTRSIKTKHGTLEDLKVSRTRDALFKNSLLTRKQNDEELAELVTELFCKGYSQIT